MAVVRFIKRGKKKTRTPWRKVINQSSKTTTRRDPLQAVPAEARILDSFLLGALQQLPDLHIPGRFGMWLARFPVEQAGNDRLVREFESFLAQLRDNLYGFSVTARELPEHLLERLSDVGLGPASFADLVDDPRLDTRARPPKRQDLEHFLREARARTEALVTQLERLSAQGYR